MKKVFWYICASAAFSVFALSPSTAIGEDVQECVPDCEGKECGDDGCGGLCGVCNAWQVCDAGGCLFNGGCQPSALPGCGDCSCQTCVCLQDPYCCTSSWDAMCVTRCETACGGCGQKNTCGDGQCSGTESCATCQSDCGQCPPACGQITSIGCCVGDNVLSCQAGALKVTTCDPEEMGPCGWSAEDGTYACGGEGADPSGQYSPECPTATVDDVQDAFLPPPECSGMSYAGCCSGKSVFWCDSMGLHSLACSANPAPFDTCGWNKKQGLYDCGFTGSDPTGENDKACPDFNTDAGADVPEIPKCTIGSLVSVGCQDINFQGCCSQAGGLYFCEKGKYLCNLHCPDLVAPADVCGWSAKSGWYDCGGDGPDPLGYFPLECPALQVPTDVVEPDVQLAPASCPSVPDGGCCDGAWLSWCENGVERTFDCTALAGDPVFGAYVFCGTNPATSKADCIKKSDPSPPDCGASKPDPAPDVIEPADGVTDVLSDHWPDGFPDAGDLVHDGASDSGPMGPDPVADVPPFIIPTDAAVIELGGGGGGGGGCGCRTGTSGREPLLPGLALVLWLSLRLLKTRRPSRKHD